MDRLSFDTVGRIARTALQAGVLNAGIVLLRAFHVPISQEQQEAIIGFSAALLLVVSGQNIVEDLSGRSVLK